MWVMGTRDFLETAKALRAYTLQDVAQRIKGDVLILAGEDDHFVPVEQVKQFESSLTQARSVTSVIYDRDPAEPNIVSSALSHSGMRLSLIGWLRNFRCTLERSLALHGDWIMKSSDRSWTLSAIILAVAGTTLIGAGLYFIVCVHRCCPRTFAT